MKVMEERIQINGIWYVKEQPDVVAPVKEIKVFEYKGLVYEDIRFCFDATFDTVDNGKLYSIKVSDKRVKPWKEETWDNGFFIAGCLGRNSDSLLSLKGDSGFSDDDVENFIAFLKEIQKRGWL
jgi:hypothetical protein